MVCRDAQTKLAHPVSPLILSTPEEQGLAEVGRGVSLLASKLMTLTSITGFKMTRQLQAEKSLTRVPPTAEEAEELHSLFLKYGQQDDAYIPSVVQEDERVWMSDTRLEKCTLMFPQERKCVNNFVIAR
jgi:acyl-coenzyme A thioesterase 9